MEGTDSALACGSGDEHQEGGAGYDKGDTHSGIGWGSPFGHSHVGSSTAGEHHDHFGNRPKFRLTRYQQSRFYTYRKETLEGEVETEVGRALSELDIQLLSHLPGNAQAKGKIERFFRFLQERLLADHKAKSMEELQALIDRWVEDYNHRHLNQETGCTPLERLEPRATRSLEGEMDDIFCLKEERKVAKDHTFTLNGVTYTLPKEPCLVALKVQMHIHPGERMRVWHGGCLAGC